MSMNDGIAAGRDRGPALRLRDAAVHELTRGRLRTLAWEAVSHGLYAPLDLQRRLSTMPARSHRCFPATAASVT
jgi:hypothetical protein